MEMKLKEETNFKQSQLFCFVAAQFENVNKIPQYFGICADRRNAPKKTQTQTSTHIMHWTLNTVHSFISRVLYHQYYILHSILCMYVVHCAQNSITCNYFILTKKNAIHQIGNFRCFFSFFVWLFIHFILWKNRFELTVIETKPNQIHTVSSYIVNVSHINLQVHILICRSMSSVANKIKYPCYVVFYSQRQNKIKQEEEEEEKTKKL